MPAAMSMPMPDASGHVQTQLSLAISSFLVRRRAQIATSIISWKVGTKYAVF